MEKIKLSTATTSESTTLLKAEHLGGLKTMFRASQAGLTHKEIILYWNVTSQSYMLL